MLFSIIEYPNSIIICSSELFGKKQKDLEMIFVKVKASMWKQILTYKNIVQSFKIIPLYLKFRFLQRNITTYFLCFKKLIKVL